MELAIHLRENVHGIHDSNLHSSLLSHFHHIKNNTLATLGHQISFLERIYIGDEFCFNRLPNFYFIDHIVDVINKENLGLTLLTPTLSQINFFSFSEILEHLHKKNPNTEIVVNDWGMIFFLKEKFPSFNLSIGRLLNKGFKDPRLRAYDYELTDEALNLLNSSTFDDPIFQDFVSNLGINRLESDIFPYKDQLIPSYKNLNTSIYFPFTYITSHSGVEMPKYNSSAPKCMSISTSLMELTGAVIFIN